MEKIKKYIKRGDYVVKSTNRSRVYIVERVGSDRYTLRRVYSTNSKGDKLIKSSSAPYNELGRRVFPAPKTDDGEVMSRRIYENWTGKEWIDVWKKETKQKKLLGWLNLFGES